MPCCQFYACSRLAHWFTKALVVVLLRPLTRWLRKLDVRRSGQHLFQGFILPSVVSGNPTAGSQVGRSRR